MLACSILTTVTGRRSVTPASVSMEKFTVPRFYQWTQDFSAYFRSESIHLAFLNVCSIYKIPLTVHFQVRCGRRPCILPKALAASDSSYQSCPRGLECVEHPFLTCLSLPCHQWGVCSAPDPPTPVHTQCEPNSGYLDNSCAHVTLIFNLDKVPQVTKT